MGVDDTLYPGPLVSREHCTGPGCRCEDMNEADAHAMNANGGRAPWVLPDFASTPTGETVGADPGVRERIDEAFMDLLASDPVGLLRYSEKLNALAEAIEALATASPVATREEPEGEDVFADVPAEDWREAFESMMAAMEAALDGATDYDQDPAELVYRLRDQRDEALEALRSPTLTAGTATEAGRGCAEPKEPYVPTFTCSDCRTVFDTIPAWRAHECQP